MKNVYIGTIFFCFPNNREVTIGNEYYGNSISYNTIFP